MDSDNLQIRVMSSFRQLVEIDNGTESGCEKEENERRKSNKKE